MTAQGHSIVGLSEFIGHDWKVGSSFTLSCECGAKFSDSNMSVITSRYGAHVLRNSKVYESFLADAMV